MTYRLHELATPADWEAMHAIRERVLFTQERHPGIVYNRAHEHDTNPAHIKFILLLDDEPIGTTRLDPRNDGGIVRLVAIVPEHQRRGHGSAMEGLVVDFARGRGMRRLWVNAAADAVGFYEKRGWTRLVWDEAELVGLGASCVQMTKPL